MRIAIRVDGSHRIGMGHVFRMINLASFLRETVSEEIAFCSRSDDQVARWLRDCGFVVEIFDQDGEILTPLTAWLDNYGADLLINDVLDTEVDYMTEVAGQGRRMVNFDDQGPGGALAECQINALPTKMLPPPVREGVFQGPEYLLLGEDFAPPVRNRPNDDSPKSILVTLGGSDTYGNTLVVVAALQQLPECPRVEIVIGPAFQHGEELGRLVAGDEGFVVHRAVPRMAEFMHKSGMAIIGGGITLFEAAACALPTVAIASESSEQVNIRWAEQKGITHSAGGGQPAAVEPIFTAARSLLADTGQRHAMSAQGPRIVDGQGRRRVVDIIRRLCK